jgi:hypothetical protein
MARTVVLALSLLALTTAKGEARAFPVVVVPGFELADLERVEERGAIGLLVPGAGPETSGSLARASLASGDVRNSLRDEDATGPPLVELTTGSLGSVAGPAIYVGLPRGGREPNTRRYPILVVGHGYEGMLTSRSTRIPGLVSIGDVAPAATGADGPLGSQPAADAAARLAELDRRIDGHNDARRPAEIVACGLVTVLAVVLPAAALPALAAVLFANLALGLAGVVAVWAVVGTVLAAVVVGALVAFVRPGELALGLGLAAAIGAYLVTLGVAGTAVALSPFGPTQNARFYGLSNLLETMLLAPALAAAALVAPRLGWPGIAAVASLAFVAVAGSRFGADGGGAVVLAVGFAVLGVLLAGARKRALAVALAGAAALAVLLLALDAVLGGESHVTRALEGGPGRLADELAGRVSLSFARLGRDWRLALLVGALAVALALLVARTIARRGRSGLPAVPVALASALAVSLVVNDSPDDVLLVGVAAYLAVDRPRALSRR